MLSFVSRGSAALLLGALLTACGAPAAQTTTTPSSAAAAASQSSASAAADAPAANLDGVKQYLLDNGNNVFKTNAAALKTNVDQYYAVVKAANFDYRAAWGDGATLRPLILNMRKAFNEAHTGYESVEGIVAGVPSLANFDTILDAGSPGDAGGDNVAEYTLTLPDGSTLDKPGNHFHNLLEPLIYGSDAARMKLTDVDVDGDGAVGFGDALPDANVLKGATDSLVSYIDQTMAAINAWQPSAQDAFTAMVTMTPTMGEYFNNWKESRFVTGAASQEPAFVAKSRLVDVTQILGSIRTIYTGVEPLIQTKDPAAAQQINQNYDNLSNFVQNLLDKEQSGTKYTPDQADVLGKTAQDQAQAITGQVAQAAALLQIQVSE